jgi:hypothetical protein
VRIVTLARIVAVRPTEHGAGVQIEIDTPDRTIALSFDTEQLAQDVVAVLGEITRARRLADASVPGGGDAVFFGHAMTVAGAAIHTAGSRTVLELRLSPSGLPLLFSLTPELVRLVCKEARPTSGSENSGSPGAPPAAP